jgi:hypothetical protein
LKEERASSVNSIHSTTSSSSSVLVGLIQTARNHITTGKELVLTGLSRKLSTTTPTEEEKTITTQTEEQKPTTTADKSEAINDNNDQQLDEQLMATSVQTIVTTSQHINPGDNETAINSDSSSISVNNDDDIEDNVNNDNNKVPNE